MFKGLWNIWTFFFWPKVPCKYWGVITIYTWHDFSGPLSLDIWSPRYALVPGPENCLKFENSTWDHGFHWNDRSLSPRHLSFIYSAVTIWGLTLFYVHFFCTSTCILPTISTNLYISGHLECHSSLGGHCNNCYPWFLEVKCCYLLFLDSTIPIAIRRPSSLTEFYLTLRPGYRESTTEWYSHNSVFLMDLVNGMPWLSHEIIIWWVFRMWISCPYHWNFACLSLPSSMGTLAFQLWSVCPLFFSRF